MKRFLTSVAMLAASISISFAAPAEKPNVLFLAVDDMNDWIGCLETTPRAIPQHLDKLARNQAGIFRDKRSGLLS